jgi:hypothetical protein
LAGLAVVIGIAIIVLIVLKAVQQEGIPPLPTRTSVAGSPVATSLDSAKTFYVAPEGDDGNPGTRAQPWRTFAHAAAHLTAGQTALFADGIYPETAEGLVTHSGTATAPIVLAAEHPHGAVLVYHGRADRNKVLVRGHDYVTIRDFAITQDVRGTSWSDKLVQCWNGADYCRIEGVWAYGSMENFKVWNSTGVVFEGNRSSETQIGFGAFNSSGTVFRDNEVIDPGQDGFQIKGGARDVLLEGNLVRTTSSAVMDIAFYLGGYACAQAECGVYDPSGYEAYRVVARNNRVEAASIGGIYAGAEIQGCHSCTFTSNTIIGAKYAFVTRKGPGPELGWTWAPVNEGASFTNNQVSDCYYGAMDFAHDAGSAVVKDNTFTNCRGAP